MNPRICLVGDSHIAALQYAFMENQGAYSGKPIAMFAARGKALADLEYENGTMMSRNIPLAKSMLRTGGTERIVLDAYDAFCIVGGQGREPLVELVCSGYSTAGMQIKNTAPVSSTLLDQMFRSLLESTLAFQLVSLFRKHTDKPIFYAGNPRVSHAVLADEEKGDFFRRAVEAGASEDIIRRFMNSILATVGKSAHFVEQPVETVEDIMFTKSDFGRGSRRLSKVGREHPEDDFNHMNADYGRLMLDKLLAQVTATA